MRFRGSSAAVVQVLVAARADGVLINRTKLAKLLYLADLEAVTEGIAPGSEVEWLWRHHGPYSNVLRDIEDDLALAGVLEVTSTTNFYGSPERRLRLLLEAPQVEIDERFAEIVNEKVSSLGRLSATQLKDLTYQTAPMLAAQALGEREVRLDLAGGLPYPNLGATLTHLQSVLDALPALADEEGAIEQLAEEIDDLAATRSAANRILLEGE